MTRPDAVLVSRPLASRLGLQVGDALPVMVGPRRPTLRVAGIFTSRSGLYPLDGAVLLMDIGPAQELLDRVGGLDYIDVIGAGPPAEVQRSLKEALPPGVEVVRPAAGVRRTRGTGGLLSPQPGGVERHRPVRGDVFDLPVRHPVGGAPPPGDRPAPDPGHDAGAGAALVPG